MKKWYTIEPTQYDFGMLDCLFANQAILLDDHKTIIADGVRIVLAEEIIEVIDEDEYFTRYPRPQEPVEIRLKGESRHKNVE